MPSKKNLAEHCPFCKAQKIGTRHYRLDGIELKQCTQCGNWKAPKEFVANSPTTSDKLNSWCKQCRSAINSAKAKLRRQNDPDYLNEEREKNRAYSEKYREDPEYRKKRAESVLKARAKNPEHYAQYTRQHNEELRQLKSLKKASTSNVEAQ